MKKLTPADPEARSDDLVAENVAKLKALFPELITEGPNGAAVNVDVLKQLVGDATVTDCDEKYGLNWHGKRQARQLALTPSTGTLRPAPEDSVDWDTTQNLVIEGDNLEVLKLLQKSYAGKVKLIYIDPPYNTGKDFVYPDNFQDSIKNYLELTGQVEGGRKISSNTEASGRFHTDWLNMMYPRLKLARNLLREDGVLFISIDDGEIGHLRTLCDEVFGAENFCGVIKRRAARKTAFLRKRMTDMCDYVVAYVRSDAAAPLSAGQVSDGTRPVFNEGNTVSVRVLRSGAIAKCGDGTYNAGTYAARSLSFELLDDLKVTDGRVARDVRIRGPWRINQETLDRTLFVTRNLGLRRTMLPEELDQAKLLNDLLDDNTCYNEKGSEELQQLFEATVFNNPKPRGLIEYLASAAGVKEKELVLDFFAGSGTTGHAVMAQNAADGGNRRYILVQLPEPVDPENKEQKVAADFCDKLGKPRNIAELTKERLRRAARKIQDENPQFAGDLGFRVFKLDTSNIRAWNPKPDDLEAELFAHQDHIVEGRSEADILYELLLKLGLDLCVPIQEKEVKSQGTEGKKYTVYAVGYGVLIACLSEEIAVDDVEALGQGIVGWRKELAPAGETTCVFRDSAFADDEAKTNLAAILNQNGIANVRSL
ncbi:DNA methylase N-4/N-6 domain protein [Acidimicrobium ferrooxidans DSM 10331]|uniref:DNA methylase N-4/N-6 domain protein n=1 Tax=Acidimicrobium ferrooxidans (strain DSM 10331 / JCM 15462 / NBRC 103882 / ICP) TaxID=525909 RepID=C7M010_ACIFD|nr:site-specific DNA-methyltransferase [Acidimicrobium ferrooxidans]ACU54318.1 DNA methylase N-4/N-6 domain protein [Acidimicrobium ferrooxidans DSM 10331]